MVYPGAPAPLARTYKVGAWYDAETFGDLRYDTNGVPLASPASNGLPAPHKGNVSYYAVADQMLWRSERDPNHALNLFVRAMGTPDGDRNLIRFSLNAGFVVHEPLRNRPDDTFGLGMGYVHVGSHAAGADQDAAAYGRAGDPAGLFPVRSSETYLEATYQWQVHPWWQLQPDIQYVWNPGGGITDPYEPARRIRNEFVVGLRTNLLF
jgi:porin